MINLNIDHHGTPAMHNSGNSEMGELYPNSVLETLNQDFRESLTNEPKREDELKTGFWRRQFNADVTTGQRKFDWVFGVILPVSCIFFDPIVFTNGNALLGAYKPFAYLTSYAAIMMTIAWLLWPRLRPYRVTPSPIEALPGIPPGRRRR